jgi:hypothetical protein
LVDEEDPSYEPEEESADENDLTQGEREMLRAEDLERLVAGW